VCLTISLGAPQSHQIGHQVNPSHINNTAMNESFCRPMFSFPWKISRRGMVNLVWHCQGVLKNSRTILLGCKTPIRSSSCSTSSPTLAIFSHLKFCRSERLVSLSLWF
jgi:hypothetical protein